MVIRNALEVIASNFGLVLRVLTGRHIKWHLMNKISVLSSIKTSNRGAIKFGKINVIRPNAELAANGGVITLGNNCFVNRNSMIVSHEAISIGDNTTIGPGVYIYDHDHDGDGGYVSMPIMIDKNVWIGAGSIILKGVKIGSNSVIAAGSVVYSDVESNVIFVQKKDSNIISRRRDR